MPRANQMRSNVKSRNTTTLIDDILDNPQTPLDGAYALYLSWLGNVEARLNAYEDQILDLHASRSCDEPDPDKAWAKAVNEAVGNVLGLKKVPSYCRRLISQEITGLPCPLLGMPIW